ncbi:hypothetical protein [Dactylosporangium sp. NPDC048998]|uniref:hypothetical protein n=1 Tax=Dactylosporangium sp. NPDC048998 TaxID=3363976 RepID=UPI00371B6631
MSAGGAAAVDEAGGQLAVSHRKLVGVFRHAPVPGAGRWLRALRAPSERAGRVLLAASILPVLALAGWLLVAVPLAALGGFHPWTVLPAAGLAMLLLVRWALPSLAAVRARPAPWWAVIGTLLVATAFAALAIVTHSEQAVLHRDAGTYAQVGLWLSGHPGLTTPVPVEAFGSAADTVTYAHPGFYVQDGLIVPQFMTGWPTLLAAGYWIGGWTGMFVLPGLVGGLAVLAVAGLAARLCGPRWALLAAALLALAWPMLRVSQTTYSEPLACLMLAGGLSLLADGWSIGEGARAAGRGSARRRAAGVLLGLAGLVLSGGELVRLDMAVDFALVLPAVGWWWLRRRPGVGPFLLGTAVGGGLGFLDCRYVTLPYVMVNWSSVRLMIALLVVMAVGTVAGALLLRRRGVPLDPHRRRLLAAAAVTAVIIGGVLLAARPLLYVDHSITAPSTMEYVASHQEQYGLPHDGTRGYAEQSLSWVSWYVGWPALVLAWTGVMVAAAGVARGRDWRLLPVLLVYAGSGVATLLRPAITPDHPWADRRLVVEVIPAVVLFATLAVARGARSWRLGASAGARSAVPWPKRALLPAVLMLALVPGVVVTAQLAPLRTELGEPEAAAAVCEALRPTDSVIMIDTQWAPTVRNQCGVPVAALEDPTVERMQTTVAAVRASGRDPVLLSSSTLPLLPYGLPLEQVVYLEEHEDQHQLVARPTGTDTRRLECWVVRP